MRQLEKRLDSGAALPQDFGRFGEKNLGEGKCEKGAPVTCQPRLIFPSCFQPASRHARPQLDPDWLSLALLASDWLQRVITALPLYGCYCTASNEE